MNIFRKWLAAKLIIDAWIAATAGAISYGLSFVHAAWRRDLTRAILDNDKWPSYMQTLSGVSASLLGFGATAIAIVLALSAGRRGKQVLAKAGSDLNLLLARCLGSLLVTSMSFAILAGLAPSTASTFLGVSFSILITLTLLRLGRLWYFLRRLLEVLITDSVDSVE